MLDLLNGATISNTSLKLFEYFINIYSTLFQTACQCWWVNASRMINIPGNKKGKGEENDSFIPLLTKIFTSDSRWTKTRNVKKRNHGKISRCQEKEQVVNLISKMQMYLSAFLLSLLVFGYFREEKLHHEAVEQLVILCSQATPQHML